MKILNSKKSCLFRITTADRQELEALLFRRYPRREWGTFLRFGYRVTSWGLHVTFVDVLAPRPGDLNRNSAIVSFDPGYILRAQLMFEKSELGVGFIHSHPQDCGTSASALDEDMDDYFASEFSIYGSGRPYISLRVAKNRKGGFSFSGDAWLRGERLPITDLCTVGDILDREAAEHYGGTGASLEKPVSWTERPQELFGPRKVLRLNCATVGLVGCSGTGSPAAHTLARAGVQKFVLVDPKFFVDSNHERFHASTWHDLGRTQLKIELVRKMILEINPEAQVVMLKGNVLDERVLDELLRCDLVLCCTDSQHGRAALSDYATHYLLPCIDSGVLMRSKGNLLNEQVLEFARYSPEEPCAWCLGKINQETLRYELMRDEERAERKRAAEDAVKRGIDGEQYWGGDLPKELTVGYATSTAGSMQAGYAEGWITGTFKMPHQRFQFDLGMPRLGVVECPAERQPGCQCFRTKGWADQARADRSVTRPWHWRSERDLGL